MFVFVFFVLSNLFLSRVMDNTNVTLSDEHMWMIPFTEGQNHTLTVDFPQTQLISGLRVWNYNKSREDTYRGVSKQLLSNLCINSFFFTMFLTFCILN